MNLSKFGLLFVIFIDLAGQGLMLPIMNTLAMDPQSGFLPADTPVDERHFYYGLIIGVFYLSWFFGAVYISKLSDSIGRKNGILVCLAGALAGYALTIVAVIFGSVWLIILGRAISGFTSGNQPIAQAAMADLSNDDAEKTRNMGYCVSALSIGLVGGPIIAGVLSDKAAIGPIASLNLPFIAACVLVLIAAVLIVFFFEDKLESRAPMQVKPIDVLLLLWKIKDRPTVLRISIVFFFFMLALNTWYVFIDNFLSSRFQIGTFGVSMVMLVIGATVAFSGAVLVGPATAHYRKNWIVACAAAVMIPANLAIIASPVAIMVYVMAVPIAIAFAIGFPTLLSMFSASVNESEQGWAMGVATALWTSGAGLISLIGGGLMSISVGLPFVVAIAAAVLSLSFIVVFWGSADIRQIAQKAAPAS